MSLDISALRKMRGQSFNKIASAFDKINSPSASYKDDRFWKLEPDKAGNASATIRFLNVTGDGLPWVKVFSHAFQGPGGKWYIESSLSTIGLTDYVGEQNSKLWNSGVDANKEIARKQKRKLQYYANVLIISDPKHPENEGKVMLFKFGKKIFDMIMDKAQPTFADETPINVFDYWDGADFKIRQKKVDGFPNYSASVWSNPAPIGSDEDILSIVNQLHKLEEFIDPKSFKSYDELKTKYLSVMNEAASSGPSAAETEDLPQVAAAQPARSAAPARVAAKPAPVEAPLDGDDDDALAFFKSLGED